jgi:hypothetical protein
MILIDDNKTVIAGEALKVMAELAVLLDRLALELESKDAINLKYDDIVNRFTRLVYNIKETRNGEIDVVPREILKNNSLKDIFPEDFFNFFNKGSRKTKDNSSTGKSSEEMLKEAMAKLNKAGENLKNTEVKKKKKKKKKKKEDK